MGHKLLIVASLVTLSFAVTLTDIDRMVERVKEPRKGLQAKNIALLKDPFVDEKKLTKIVKKRKKRKRWSYRLQAIFDKRAKINGRWYKEGSKIGSFRIGTIGKEYVLLQRGKERLRLYLKPRQKKRFKFIAKDSR